MLPLLLAMMNDRVSIDHLRGTLVHLEGYPTRNTSARECRQAVQWLAEQFRAIPGMRVEVMEYPITKGRRVPADTVASQVIATLPGETERRVMMGAHLDTINLAGDPLTALAPGINDDGSGIASTLECARLMGGRHWHNTLVFVGFTGEEQGLFGSTALAHRAKAEGWKIDALLSNDTIGSSQGNGRKELNRVRLYSEDSSNHDSRELARFIEWCVRGKIPHFGPQLVFRKDRFQRGGDHSPFNTEGFPAVRFVEALEAFDHQHTEKDALTAIDFNYLAHVTQLNLISLEKLASAEERPTEVHYDPKQSYDTILRWHALPGVHYAIYWRATDSPVWQGYREVGQVSEARIENVNKDDCFFAVGAVGGVPVSAG